MKLSTAQITCPGGAPTKNSQPVHTPGYHKQTFVVRVVVIRGAVMRVSYICMCTVLAQLMLSFSGASGFGFASDFCKYFGGLRFGNFIWMTAWNADKYSNLTEMETSIGISILATKRIYSLIQILTRCYALLKKRIIKYHHEPYMCGTFCDSADCSLRVSLSLYQVL